MAKSLENRHGTVSDPTKRRSYGRLLLDAVAEIILKVSMFGFGFVWWTLRWTFAVLVFIGIMFVAGYYVYNEALAGGPYVTVPDIVGKSYPTEAGEILARNNLVMGENSPVQTNKGPENIVMHQRPMAGRVVRAGRKVYPSVSQFDVAETPSLVGMTLEAAREKLKELGFRGGGAISRLPNRAPVDQVIGQDPAANETVPQGSEITLLVSDGRGTRQPTVYMPDLSGMSPEAAAQELAPLNVEGRLVKVDGSEPPFDQVISQRPDPGTLLRPGQIVTYDVRTNTPVANAWRKVTIVYTIPQSAWMEREPRIDVIYKDGTRKTAFPTLEYYVDGLPPKYEPGTTIRQKVNFQGELTVEIYLDGQLVRSYYYEGDADPVIRDFDTPPPGEPSSAGT